MKNISLWYWGFVLIMSVFSCSYSSGNKNDFIAEFNKNIEMALNDGNKSIVNINDITKFEWEYFYVFKPYTSINDINSTLGFNWSDAASTLINQSDSYNLLVFIEDDKVIKYFKLPRRSGDFMKLNTSGPFIKNESKFIVKREIYGTQDWVFLYKVD